MAKLLDALKENGVEITEEIEKKVMEEFVEKKDVDLKDTKISELEEQLNTRNKDIEELKKIDGTKLKEELDSLQTKYNDETEALKKKLQNTQFENALDLALTGINTKDSGLVKTLLDREKLQLKDGKIEGLTEQIESIKKEKDFLFNSAETKNETNSTYTYTPKDGKAGNELATINDAVAQAMGFVQ